MLADTAVNHVGVVMSRHRKWLPAPLPSDLSCGAAHTGRSAIGLAHGIIAARYTAASRKVASTSGGEGRFGSTREEASQGGAISTSAAPSPMSVKQWVPLL